MLLKSSKSGQCGISAVRITCREVLSFPPSVSSDGLQLFKWGRMVSYHRDLGMRSFPSMAFIVRTATLELPIALRILQLEVMWVIES